MFSLFFAGMQQDFKLAVLPPILCALFRLAFILVYGPKKSPVGEWRKWYHCFRYGFWWGMDFNAYAFLIPMLLVSLPGAFLPSYFAVGDTVRLGMMLLYAAGLYTAFMGKLIFYYHFHDTFNHMVKLGRHADKKNFADIFFHQNHGAWILLGYFPYLVLCLWAGRGLLAIPSVPYITLDSELLQYGLNTAVFVLAVLMFYWFRYGGYLSHRMKPEWDEVPRIVKDDMFLAKATLDDLVALKLAWKHPVSEALMHDDETAWPLMKPVLPVGAEMGGDPMELFHREAKGARIRPPEHIFFLFGEGHAQAPFDPIFANLNLMEASLRFRADPHTIAIQNFLSAGMISQPSLVSVILGIYDADMELNENKDFWMGTVRTSLPLQLKRLGYRTEFWYGGGLNWSSLDHFIPAAGFDAWHGGFDICAPDAPRTWLGVYDHLFLEAAAERIRKDDSGQPVFHFLYTTSNHGPYHMPMTELGFDMDRVMPGTPEVLRTDKMTWRKLGGCWYCDQALVHFIDEMREAYPDSMFIVTGDHSVGLVPLEHGIIERREPSLREHILTSFAIHHPDLEPEHFAGNTIGCHMNILPTLIELIAPKGFAYDAMFPSLTEPVDHVVTPYCWMTREKLGDYRSQVAQPLTVSAKALPFERDTVRFAEERDAFCELTGWMVRHPELLKAAD